MKYYKFIALFPLLLASCINYNNVTSEVSLNVQLQMPAEFTQGTDLEGHNIVLSLNGTDFTAQTNAEGMATFTGLIPDVYSLSTAWDISKATYSALTGTPQLLGATVSGALNELLISEASTSSPILLPTNVAVKRDVVISKIASAGSKDQNNRSYMAGKYMELYNQSDDPVDVSGLFIGLLDSSNPQPYTLENLHDDYADSVVLVKQIFQIPADEPYMVPSGGTILLTNSATDHRDVSDTEQDLRDADFEAKDASGNTVNNPETPALLTAWTASGNSATMNLVQGGPCGIIIFRTDESFSDWKLTYAYGKTTGLQYLLVPKRLILDGVDYLKNKPTGVDVSTKRLYTEIDAGYININSINGWTGEVVYRRTARISEKGHPILMDTNNSSNDFKVSTTIKPREYDNE